MEVEHGAAGHEAAQDKQPPKAPSSAGCKGNGNCNACQAERQLTRTTSTRLSENVGARPSPDQASDEIELTDPSERLSERQ
jgi:hypothetical protein